MKFKVCSCGNDVFYMPQYFSGICHFRIHATGDTENLVDNSDLHSSATYRDIRKHYRCSKCDRIAVREEK